MDAPWARSHSTHNEKYRIPFEPLPGEVIFVPYGDAAALASVVDDTVAAVVLEPIQGENGVVVPPEGPCAGREICDQHGALLWMDEVQTGMGRCGSWLVHVDEGVAADIVTVAKGLGNGFPVGPVSQLERLREFWVQAATAALSVATRLPPSRDWL